MRRTMQQSPFNGSQRQILAPAIISRDEAKARGLTRYFTGRACKRGHVAERQVINRHCLVCQRAYERAWYLANLEKYNATQRAWREANYKRVYAQQRTWFAANCERERVRKRIWLEANRKRVNALHRALEKANPERARMYYHTRRARKKGNGGSHTVDDLKTLWQKQNSCCAYCKTKLTLTTRSLDHIIPVSKGGSNNPDNLAWACSPCNTSKGMRNLDIFLCDLKTRTEKKHPLSGDNLYLYYKNGKLHQRMCRICRDKATRQFNVRARHR